jgi:hypothetical protein
MIPVNEGFSQDLKATSKTHDRLNKELVFETNLSVLIPDDCIGVITPLESIKNTLLGFGTVILPSGFHKIEVRFGRGPRPYRNYDIGDYIAHLEVRKK